jgi:hypothetical protein
MKNTKQNALKAYGTVDAWFHTLLTLALGWVPIKDFDH